VEVHYCKVSDIRKPRGAPAGLVHLERYSKVRVRPGPPEDTDPSEGVDPEGS
jgi:hypothetical protein